MEHETASMGDHAPPSGERPVWHPGPAHLERSCVAQMIRATGQRDFDAMQRYSNDRPADYWRTMMRYLGIVWRRDYDSFCDLSRGAPFPSWFVGGRLNWTDTVFQWADDPATRDKPAIVAVREDGTTDAVTYPELRDLTTRVAHGLAARGVGPGDRIGMLMETGIEAAAALLALSHLGAIVVPLFSGFAADPIVARLDQAGATGLIATTGFERRGRFVDTVPVVREVLERLPALRRVVVKVSPKTPGADTLPPDWTRWSDLAAPTADATPEPGRTMQPDDPFMVIYTSGTTGKPKGVVHTHGGFALKIAHDAAQNLDITSGDTFCWPADMGWIAGSLVLCSAILRGATLVCYDGAPDFPDWSRMSRLIEAHGVTHFGSAPTLIRGMAANAALATAGDLSTIRLLVTAGEGIAPEHFQWFQNNFGHGEAPLINYTGGTEVSGGLLGNVVCKPIVPSGFNAASAGLDADVVAPDGTPVTGEVGELVLRGPFVGMTRSFWQDDARYLDTYWHTIPGLWVHGDLAIRDAAGNLFLTGRSDDTMKIAGKRVGPAEVEEILVEIDGIAEAAVIGVPDEVKGQSIVAFVTGRDLPALADLVAMVRERVQSQLGKPFAPRDVHVVDELPKTQSSKIMRRMIRSAYTGTPPGDTTSLVNPDALEAIAAQAPDRTGRH